MDIKSGVSFKEIDSFHALCHHAEMVGLMSVLTRWGIVNHDGLNEYVKRQIDDIDNVENIYGYLIEISHVFDGDYYFIDDDGEIYLLDDEYLDEFDGFNIKDDVLRAIQEGEHEN